MATLNFAYRVMLPNGHTKETSDVMGETDAMWALLHITRKMTIGNLLLDLQIAQGRAVIRTRRPGGR